MGLIGRLTAPIPYSTLDAGEAGKGAEMKAGMRLLLLGAALACGSLQAAESPPIHPAVQAAVDSQERLPKDRARDDNRHYAQVMEFFGVPAGNENHRAVRCRR